MQWRLEKAYTRQFLRSTRKRHSSHDPAMYCSRCSHIQRRFMGMMTSGTVHCTRPLDREREFFFFFLRWALILLPSDNYYMKKKKKNQLIHAHDKVQGVDRGEQRHSYLHNIFTPEGHLFTAQTSKAPHRFRMPYKKIHRAEPQRSSEGRCKVQPKSLLFPPNNGGKANRLYKSLKRDRTVLQ